MEIQQVRSLLEGVSTERSQWEYEHFVLERHAANWPRQVVSQLKDLRSILDRRHDLELAAWSASNQTLRNELEKQQVQIETWLSKFTDEEIKEAVADYEHAEAEFWPQELGRRAAIDMLATGRISKEVTELALMLDEESFKTYVRVCGDIATGASDLSKIAEQEAGQMPEGLPR
jgi:hypothetical protein